MLATNNFHHSPGLVQVFGVRVHAILFHSLFPDLLNPRFLQSETVAAWWRQGEEGIPGRMAQGID
jgi:hypothetical protein